MIIAVNFQWNKEAWKKFRALTGFEPMTSAIPVRCSTNWAMKPHIGSEVNVSSYFPVRGVKWCYMKWFIYELRADLYESKIITFIITFICMHPQFIYESFHIHYSKLNNGCKEVNKISVLWLTGQQPFCHKESWVATFWGSAQLRWSHHVEYLWSTWHSVSAGRVWGQG